MIDVDGLEAFVVFTEHLNFTRAARVLHLSQPALHSKIGRLSEAIGVALYRRVGRRLELTDEGKKVACFGRDMGEATRHFLDELLTGKSRQPVVLAAGAGSYLYLLGEAIESFGGAGSVPLRLLTMNRDGSLEAVRSGQAHMGVAPFESLPLGVEGECIATIPQIVVVSEDHELAKERVVSLKALDGMRLVVPPPAKPHREALEQALLSAGVSWSVGVEATGWELLLHFVKLGMGFAVVNGFCRLPKGFVGCRVAELPSLRYFVFRRAARSWGSEEKMLWDRIVNQVTTMSFFAETAQFESKGGCL